MPQALVWLEEPEVWVDHLGRRATCNPEFWRQCSPNTRHVNTRYLTLGKLFEARSVPKHGILSYRWTADELTYKEFPSSLPASCNEQANVSESSELRREAGQPDLLTNADYATYQRPCHFSLSTQES